MSSYSWIFVHKYISDATLGNGEIIERSALWRHSSSDLGADLASYYELPSGGYIYSPLADIRNYIEHLLNTSYSIDDEAGDRDALLELKGCLDSASDEHDYFISVD